jgi:4'-phosphopantetheinyl transferase
LSFELSPAEVHVWQTPTQLPAELRQSCEGWLSDVERLRAERFRLPRLRRQFVARRGLLRAVLASYLAAPPEDLCFAYGHKDKPRLTGDPGWEKLEFNCSHSGDVALIAVTRAGEIGVDVERIRADVRHAELAARFFAPAEATALARRSGREQRQLFFHLWTAKEAWIKAVGGGLSIPLRQFEIRVRPGDPPVPVLNPGDGGEEALGWVYPLEVAPGYAGALAAGESDLEVRLRRWRPESTGMRAM